MLGLKSPVGILKIHSKHTCTHPCTPSYTRTHWRTHLSTPAHTRTHPCTPAHTRTHPCTPAHTPAHTRAHLCIPRHSQAHPTPVYKPLNDTYRIGANIAIFPANRFCRYGKSLSESVIGIGRYRVQYRWTYRYILNPAPG